jgi:hypothetical protein
MIGHEAVCVHGATEARCELTKELQVGSEISRLQEAGIPVDTPLDYVKRITGEYGASASRHAPENDDAALLVDFQMRKMGSVPI